MKFLIEKNFYLPKMENLKVSERLISSFDVDFIEPENLLFQRGYLTIKKCQLTARGLVYHLGYPNREVKVALNENLSAFLAKPKSGEEEEYKEGMKKAFLEGNIREIETIFRSLFAGIPYEWHKKADHSHYEGYYASVVYSFLDGAGLEIIP